MNTQLTRRHALTGAMAIAAAALPTVAQTTVPNGDAALFDLYNQWK